MKVDGKFIYVCDENKKSELEAAGYKLIQKTEKFWVFLNNQNTMAFSQNSGVAINNTLTF